MKTICKNFLIGKCRYGDRCRFVHPTTTKLLDPPSWIYISIDNIHTTEISTDEVRYSLLVGDTRKILDDIWIDNYTKMYKALNGICRNGIGRSLSSRCVDLRKTPEVFNLPFDIGRVEEKIVELRKINPIIEDAIIKGEESEGEEPVLEEEKIPKFIKEFKEKKESGNYNNNREYRPNQPSSYTNRPNQPYSKPNQSYSYNRDGHRDQPYNTSYRQDTHYKDTHYKDTHYKDPTYKDTHYKDTHYKPPFSRDPNYKPPYNDPGYKDPNYKPVFSRDSSYKPPFSRDSSYKPSYNSPNYKDPYNNPGYKDPNYKPSFSRDTPYNDPGYKPSFYKPPYNKKDDDSDFENKNIPYDFDRK